MENIGYFHYFLLSIVTFVDVFGGGASVGINANSKKLLLNDNLIYLIDLYKFMKLHTQFQVLKYIDDRIKKLKLSKTNIERYLELRKQYNTYKHPLDLFILTAYSFNHQICFNTAHEFNTHFGKERSSFNSSIRQNLIQFIDYLHNNNVELSNVSL